MQKRILIVDDEEDYADLVSRILKANGYYVETAGNGQEGLQKLKDSLFDLVLLDVNMPKMNGWDTCRTIKSDEKTKTVPVIMFTVRSKEEEQVRGLDLGADDYITKPFDSEVLLARVEMLVNR